MSKKPRIPPEISSQLSPEQLKRLKEVVSREVRKGTNAVHIIGSLARGEFGPESDIDLISDTHWGLKGEHTIIFGKPNIEVWRESDDKKSFLDKELPHKTIFSR